MARKQQKVSQDAGRKRGQIVSKGNGSYLVRVPLTTSLNGKRRSASRVIRGTYRQADQLRVKMLAELDNGGVIATSKQTVAEYMEQWLTGTAALKVSPRTLIMYRYLTKRYIVSAIGTHKLANLSPAMVQAVYSGMTTRGLGQRIVRYTHTVLKSAISQAVQWRQLPFNPCDSATLPRAEREEPIVLTAAQVSTVLAQTAGVHPWGIFWNVMLNTGMRPQEAAALTWGDLVDGGDKLRITKALVEVKPGHYEIGPTKTKRSMRTISLPSSTVAALAAHKADQAKRILKAGPEYQRNGLIFATRSGTHIDLHNAYRAWRAMLKRLHLPLVTLYCCRHTHISLLLAAGEPGPAVAERAGHSLDTMMKVYAHVIPETVPQIANNFEKLLTLAATGT